MASPVQALNENFFYNSMLARALIQLFPENDRGGIREWLDKLHKIEGDREKLNLRNDYMWFLLLVLQNKKIKQPFDRPPPAGELRPLRDILPERVYEEVLASNEKNVSWLEHISGDEEVPPEIKPEIVTAPPSVFLENQPVPNNGIICYLAAFSDHDY